MFTDEQLAQLRRIMREEAEPLHAKIDGTAERLNAKIDGVEQRLGAKLDASQKEFGALLSEILQVVSEHHVNLKRRVTRLEEHGGLPKSH